MVEQLYFTSKFFNNFNYILSKKIVRIQTEISDNLIKCWVCHSKKGKMYVLNPSVYKYLVLKSNINNGI